MKLDLGVNDVAYSVAGGKSATTTFAVANILESKYHVMRTFVELHDKQISDMVGASFAGAVEALELGGVASPQINTSGVDAAFRNYLESDEWRQTSGQHIHAAEAGHSKRRLHHATKRKARPAFIDTGLYRASFRTKLVT